MTEPKKLKPWLPYVLPFVIYLAFLLIETPTNLPWLYPVKTLVVAVALWTFRKHYEELRLSFSLWAVVIGIVAIAIWIAIDPYYPKLGTVTAFDPTGRWAFILFRVLGAVLVVPLMEELFWRAFLIRWLVNEDFKKVPVGTFTWASFAITVVMFGAEHREWLAGLICGGLYNWLYYKRNDVFACVLAHAISNAVLAAWVLARADWKFW